jgi:hypothetical protein
MTDDNLMRLARKHEGADPGNEIPEVVALTPLELAALAKDIRRYGLEEAAAFMDKRADELAACGNLTADTMARIYRVEAAAIRALSQKEV